MELAGTAWTLVEFETDTGVIPALEEAPATLDFSTEGEKAGMLSGAFAKFTPLLAEELFQYAAVFDGGDASPTQTDAYGHSSTPLPLQQHRLSPAMSGSGVLSGRASVESSTTVRSH